MGLDRGWFMAAYSRITDLPLRAFYVRTASTQSGLRSDRGVGLSRIEWQVRTQRWPSRPHLANRASRIKLQICTVCSTIHTQTEGFDLFFTLVTTVEIFRPLSLQGFTSKVLKLYQYYPTLVREGLGWSSLLSCIHWLILPRRNQNAGFCRNRAWRTSLGEAWIVLSPPTPLRSCLWSVYHNTVVAFTYFTILTTKNTRVYSALIGAMLSGWIERENVTSV